MRPAAMRAYELNDKDLKDLPGCTDGLIVVAIDMETALTALVTLDRISIHGFDNRIINFLTDIIDSIT